MPYSTDLGDHGVIEVAYPFQLPDAGRRTLPAVALGVAVYLGQLCLAQRIVVDFPVSSAMAAAMVPLAQMLYDVRCWKDGISLRPPPSVQAPIETMLPEPQKVAARRSLLLWSGGKDSSLAALMLRDNDYEVTGLHVTVNDATRGAEERAVTELAGAMDVPLLTLRFRHADFLRFSSRYAREWNRFPLCNTVPFGRDLLLALLAVPVARHIGAAALSMGHDYECRNAYLTYDGRSIPRNDVESTRGALALEAYIQRFVMAEVDLLPPVAGLRELRILREMLIGHPELMRRAAFCFWGGGNCGRCAKCLRYYLAQRLFGVDVLTFRVNPLSSGACPELDHVLQADPLGDEPVLFADQVKLCLLDLVGRADIRPEETRLREVARAEAGMDVSGALRALMKPGGDPQLPVGFRYRDWSPSK